MIKSMTGYGRVVELISGYDLTVEIRSVNHRYFDFSAKVPRAYGYLEEKLKKFVHQQVSRGKIDVFVGINAIEIADTQVQINEPLARSYFTQLQKLGESLSIKDNIKLSHIAQFNDIYTLRRSSEDEGFIWELVEKAAKTALEKFTEMREIEGEKLREDISARLKNIEKAVGFVEEKSPIVVQQWREKLFKKMSQVLEEKQIDESRILSEAAIFAEKIAVDEETVRLRSHLQQFEDIMKEEDAIGRKLDFLVQEINREINTIGSKSQDIEATKIVVELKSEVEKIREQIQNIE